ncbi:MAG: dTDP-4-dehydrorhamnose reductase [Coprobacter sp.]|nr:dTDP-4-dehydrorhamnose reductase [Coprobacter sp.]
MSTILVTGADGQLGNEMRNCALLHSGHNFIFTDVQELDITDARSVSSFVAGNKVDYIVNCAAYTAVDRAEDDADRCRCLNALAVQYLAEAAAASGARMIHISTDYVYSGSACRPYAETDPVQPSTVYGRTKLEGEQLLFRACPQSVVLRTSWLYSPYGNNFVKTMIRLGQERDRLTVVFDQTGTPTCAADLAAAVMQVVNAPRFVPGVYNFSDEGVCSWYDFTLAIHRLAGISGCRVEPVESSEYPAKAVRPFYSVMNKKKIKETYKIAIPHWEESLARCIALLNK